ncbi:hypothetical protein D9758_002790 [Tetrapyrgos nigripes]|uniref:Uncharacterized protein n=1 Tax=Tetrapyrgos nigripes TaxID=182062 RepID=A0A8H5GQW3_9AGAR|nr:hypothetical protein D9758_002790 [Tetrapyrgos nigripes]
MTTPMIPTDDQILLSLLEIRKSTPGLGRAKILSRLKSENQWTLSDARLKKMIHILTAREDSLYRESRTQINELIFAALDPEHNGTGSSDSGEDASHAAGNLSPSSSLRKQPTDMQLLAALEEIREMEAENVPRAKILARVRTEHGWDLSDKRLKRWMKECYGHAEFLEPGPSLEPGLDLDDYGPEFDLDSENEFGSYQGSSDSDDRAGPGSVDEEDDSNSAEKSPMEAQDIYMTLVDSVLDMQGLSSLPESHRPRIPEYLDQEDKDESGLPLPDLPQDAFDAQMVYMTRDKDRGIILYGRGRFDYFFMPEPTMRTFFSDVLENFAPYHTFGPPKSPERKLKLAEKGWFMTLWELYEVGAQKAGISRADVGRQFEAEFGVNMHHYTPSRQQYADDQTKEILQTWEKERAMKWMAIKSTLMLQLGIDKQWDETRDGQFAIQRLRKIDRETGEEWNML